MTSVDLKDTEDIAKKYADDNFDGNLSAFLRAATKEYVKNHNPLRRTLTMQTMSFLLISICFLMIGISFFSNIIAVLIPSITMLCGIFLFIYLILLIKKPKMQMRGV